MHVCPGTKHSLSMWCTHRERGIYLSTNLIRTEIETATFTASQTNQYTHIHIKVLVPDTVKVRCNGPTYNLLEQ